MSPDEVRAAQVRQVEAMNASLDSFVQAIGSGRWRYASAEDAARDAYLRGVLDFDAFEIAVGYRGTFRVAP